MGEVNDFFKEHAKHWEVALKLKGFSYHPPIEHYTFGINHADVKADLKLIEEGRCLNYSNIKVEENTGGRCKEYVYAILKELSRNDIVVQDINKHGDKNVTFYAGGSNKTGLSFHCELLE